MVLPITILFIVPLFFFSLYYDIKERRIPNWIILYSFIFLTAFYIYMGIFYEFELLVKQLSYIFQFSIFLFIIYFFSKLNPGDIKLLIISAYSLPYIYIKYTVLESLPLISIFVNLGICGLIYFLLSINFKVLKNKANKIFTTFFNLFTYMIPVIVVSKIIISYISKIFHPFFLFFSGILLVIFFIRITGIFLKEIKNNKLLNLLIFLLSIFYIIYIKIITIFLIITPILMIFSVYNSLKEEEFLKKENIPFSIFIILSMLLTLVFQGDIVAFFKNIF